MPVYEYACNTCEHEFEKFQKMSDTTTPPCPDCGSEQVRKLISRSSFHLKGGGWYTTDYKSSGSKSGSVQAKSDSASSESSPSASEGASGGCGGGCACHAPKA